MIFQQVRGQIGFRADGENVVICSDGAQRLQELFVVCENDEALRERR